MAWLLRGWGVVRRKLLFAFPREQLKYRVKVVSYDSGKVDFDTAPVELRYVIAKKPDVRISLERLFERGYGIGIRTIAKTPEDVLRAVDVLSTRSQRGTLEPWLMRLITKDEIPVFTEDELRNQYEKGMNLFDEAQVILAYRHRMKRLILVDLEESGIEDRDWHFVEDLNRELKPLAEEYLMHRIHQDWRLQSIDSWRMLAKVFLVIGSVAHLLELSVRGMGIVFAAVADDVIHESSKLYVLRGSGFTKRQLLKRASIAVPVLILSVWLALSVDSRIKSGDLWTAGFVFGIAAVLFSISVFAELIISRVVAYRNLHNERKLAEGEDPHPWARTWHDLTTSPYHLGRMIGLVITPFASGIAFIIFPSLVRNGWFLATLASLDVWIMIGAVHDFRCFGNKRFASRMLRRISNAS